MSAQTHPGLARLDALLAGEADIRVIRPPEPRGNPRHDLFGPQDAAEGSVEALLGREHFSEPAKAEKMPAKLYTIGQMAAILGRKSQMIRLWIRHGTIPEATHWTEGEGLARKRLFSEHQVMSLVAILSSEGLQGAERYDFSKTSFSARAWEMWFDD